MSKERLPNIHPGEILRLEFLELLEITPYRLSKDIGVAQTRISEILAEKRGITADTALRLSRYFGNSAQFWLNLQAQYDLRQAEAANAEIYSQIPTLQLGLDSKTIASPISSVF
jgi:antitoxin HigA-1